MFTWVLYDLFGKFVWVQWSCVAFRSVVVAPRSWSGYLLCVDSRLGISSWAWYLEQTYIVISKCIDMYNVQWESLLSSSRWTLASITSSIYYDPYFANKFGHHQFGGPSLDLRSTIGTGGSEHGCEVFTWVDFLGCYQGGDVYYMYIIVIIICYYGYHYVYYIYIYYDILLYLYLYIDIVYIIYIYCYFFDIIILLLLLLLLDICYIHILHIYNIYIYISPCQATLHLIFGALFERTVYAKSTSW